MTYLAARKVEHSSEWIDNLREQRKSASEDKIPAIDAYIRRLDESLRRKDPDERDMGIIQERLAARVERDEPLTGDWIRFSDGVYLRIAYCWRDGEGWQGSAQTDDRGSSGSYHLLTSGGCSMSGGLDPGVPLTALKRTDETREGSAWIFHHDFAGADRGRNFLADFRVWEYDGPSSDAGYWPHPHYHAMSLDPEQHSRTCGYWYTVTKDSMGYKAFVTRAEFERWLEENGLTMETELPAERGEWGSTRLVKVESV